MESVKETRTLSTQNNESALHSEKISRMEFIKQASFLLAGLYVGCSPVKILLKAYPDEFKKRSPEMDEILRAFVVTVIPGAPVDGKDLIKMYYDDYYPCLCTVP